MILNGGRVMSAIVAFSWPQRLRAHGGCHDRADRSAGRGAAVRWTGMRAVDERSLAIGVFLSATARTPIRAAASPRRPIGTQPQHSATLLSVTSVPLWQAVRAPGDATTE